VIEAHSEPKPLIELRGARKSFHGRAVLKDITLTIPEGGICGIIGPSGAGKTTLLRLLIGFYKPTGGEILIEGQPAIRAPPELFGFCTQENAFYDELTCRENLAYFGRLYGMDEKLIAESIAKALRLVDMTESADVIAHDLSGGMQRRLDFAIAILHAPKVLILDEPTTGLDPKLRKQVWSLISRISQLGITVVVSSHILADMEHYCTHLAILYGGRILEQGPPDQLKDLYSRNEEVTLETVSGDYQAVYAEVGRRIPISYARHDGKTLVLYVQNAESTIRAVLDVLQERGDRLLDIDVNRPTLSEVFEALIAQQENGGGLRTVAKQVQERPSATKEIMVLLREGLEKIGIRTKDRPDIGDGLGRTR